MLPPATQRFVIIKTPAQQLITIKTRFEIMDRHKVMRANGIAQCVHNETFQILPANFSSTRVYWPKHYRVAYAMPIPMIIIEWNPPYERNGKSYQFSEIFTHVMYREMRQLTCIRNEIRRAASHMKCITSQLSTRTRPYDKKR